VTIPGSRGAPHPGRTGLVLRDPLSWPDLRQVVQTAEATGYEAVFVPESAGREAFTTLTGFALATSSLRVGTGVVTVRSRAPEITAMAVATLQDLSGGRAILGLGSGSPSTRSDGPGPIELVRRYVAALRRLLAGEPAEDERLGLAQTQLGLPDQSEAVPIWLAALGDRMVRLAGEVADGVLLNWCTPERVASARRLIAESAERAGRDPGQVTVAVYVRACLGLEEPVAVEALKDMAGRYSAIPHYLRQFERMGLGADAGRAAASYQAGRPQEVPEALVRAVCVAGGRREALTRFAEYRQAGADLVLCYPVAALDPFSSLLGTVLGAAPSPSLEG
jgi:alkanesulfonate monooxygenase SsuD/methylene tetrahydromethanopterin reductase-like flavin-dependent oxidoreductase (luciferase family)